MGTSYYRSWSPGSTTIDEGYCTYEEVPVDVGGVIAGTLALVGIIWLITPDNSTNKDVFSPYESFDRIGFSIEGLPKAYFARASLKKVSNNQPKRYNIKSLSFNNDNLFQIEIGFRY